MSGRKEQSQWAYHAKTEHKKNDKEKKNKNHNLQELEIIQQFNQERLMQFLESKYDKILEKDEELYIKLNHAILIKIRQIKTEFLNTNKQAICDFIKKGNGNLKDQQYQAMLRHEAYPNPNDILIIQKPINDLRYVLITINKQTQNKQSRLFFCDQMPQKCDDDLDLKRLKKESIAFLQNFIRLKKRIQKEVEGKY